MAGTIQGNEFTVADAFTGAHGTGTHFHSNDALTPPALVADLAEVGGFFGDEVSRGFSLFDLSSLTADVATATLQFQVADMTSLIGVPVGGMYGQGPSTEMIAVEVYKGNGTENLSDYNATVLATLGTFDATGAAADDIHSYDIKTWVNALRGDGCLGIRVRQITGDENSEAITFDRFQISYTGGSAPTTEPPKIYLAGPNAGTRVEIVCWVPIWP